MTVLKRFTRLAFVETPFKSTLSIMKMDQYLYLFKFVRSFYVQAGKLTDTGMGITHRYNTAGIKLFCHHFVLVAKLIDSYLNASV